MGEENSGAFHHDPVFDHNGSPHNPLTDAGGIILCALVLRAGKKIADILKFYKQITFSKKVEIDFELSEKYKFTRISDQTLMNLMLASKKFPIYETHDETMEKALLALQMFQ